MAIKWKRISFPTEQSVDPYIYWSTGPARPYFLPSYSQDERVTAILQLLNGATVSAFRDAYFRRADQEKVKPHLQISVRYLRAKKTNTTFFPISVTTDFFGFLLADKELRQLVRAVVIGPPLADGSFDPDGRNSEPLPAVPDGNAIDGLTVVGVIDDGIAFGNCRFQRPDHTTRVENAWVQDGLSRGDISTVLYGREFWKSDRGPVDGIDTLIAQSSLGGFFDEETFYRLTGQADFGRAIFKTVALQSSHGTHVMDVAAGEDPATDCSDRPIICVQLPASVTADTSGARFDPYVLDAVFYIIDRADRLAVSKGLGPLPIVINFSYGIVAGPHDGTSPLEIELDNIIQDRRLIAPIEIVLPSGNSYPDRLHAKIAFEERTASQRLDWRVSPDDRTSSFMEIWMPHQAQPATPSRMKVTLALPANGGVTPPLAETHNTGFIGLRNGEPICMLFYQSLPFPTRRGMFFVALLPTAFLDPPTELAPSGLWSVNLINETLECNQPIEAWIQRDDTPYGYPQRGRPSYFDQACYERFKAGGFAQEDDDPKCVVQRAGSISAIATGAETIVIGGMQRKEVAMASYSAGGPITGSRDAIADDRRPDAVAVSDDSSVFKGVLGAGTRSGSVVMLQGTSVAAPRMARWIAEQLANGVAGDRGAVQTLAASAEAAYPADIPVKPTMIRSGEGRIILPPVYPVKRYD